MAHRNKYKWQMLLRQSWWQHLLFWILICGGLLVIFSSSSPRFFMSIDVIYTLVFALPLMGITYLNLYVLVPLLLSRERYMAYALAFPMLVASGAALLYLLFDRWIDFLLANYYFISYYSFWELTLFSGSILAISTLLKLSRSWFRLLRADRMATQHRLRALQSQINPHFLLNSLQSIYALSLEPSEQTPDVILKLSDILKYTLYETERPRISLEDEMALVKDYVDMYRLRKDPERVEISLELEGDPAQWQIAPMLLIPFIENCFKHGMTGKKSPARILIRLEVKGQRLQFLAENDMQDKGQLSMDHHTGIGMENTRQRLELMYPGRHRLQIRQENRIFRVSLNLQLDQ